MPLSELRLQTLAGYAHLPDAMKGLDTTAPYPVAISQALRDLADRIDRESKG